MANQTSVVDTLPGNRSDIRNIVLCVVAVAFATLLAWPVGEIPYGDDFAYSHVALQLARTGHFSYNGWETNVLLLHSLWGALFIRLFGFSFLCLRLSTVPFSLAVVALCYLLVRRTGLRPELSLFVSLLLGLSPVFLPVAASFMTDVPGLFFMLLSFYCFVRAAERSEMGGGYGWLAFGFLASFLGGTGRQVVWLVPIIVLPYLAWVRRKHRAFAFATIFSWLMVVVGMAAITNWFNHQPYGVPQLSPFSELRMALKKPLWELNVAARLFLMILLLVLPAAIPLVWRSMLDTLRGSITRKLFVGGLLLAVAAAVCIHPSLASIPWVPSTLNWEGVNGSFPLVGRPIVLARPVRFVVSLAVYFAACVLAGEFTNVRALARRALSSLVNPQGTQFALSAVTIFNVLYFGLLVVRLADIEIFDRYLLITLPWLATVLLLWAEDNQTGAATLKRAMPVAWATLAVLAFYAIASTQDYWALGRARVTAVNTLIAAGVPRASIDAGLEYNGWTQLEKTGLINSRWVVNPRGFYKPNLTETPIVVPIYRLEYEPTVETAATSFGYVSYFSVLPPFHKRVSIDRVLASQTLR
jgi:4-amino-4-deoxy-L-arabinose transferase-like glycosyltransferase